MNQQTAIKVLSEWAKKGRYVFTFADLAKLFPEDKRKTLQEGINRLVKTGLLQRASRGVYVYSLVQNTSSYTIEHITQALRRGEYNYISLESALSEYGVISQIPIDRLTVMTTGRSGTYQTPWGTIEFTHTKRSVTNIIANTQTSVRPLRIGTVTAAWRDLKRVGRNIHMVDEEALRHA